MKEEKKTAQKHSAALPGGTILKGRYQVEKPLGQGGFGITYSALDTKTYTRVAVKELFPSRNVTRGEDSRTVRVNFGEEHTFTHLRHSFEQEAQTLIQLQNLEGVVRLMHLFGENNTAYYVMELLEGEDLSKRLKKEGIMSWQQLAPIMKTVLNALEDIHAAGMIHRDLTPDNIFLTEKGARLIDFGSVRAFKGDSNFTAMVKKNFAPWEQFLTKGHQGPWTDIYSLSVTAYYALSGQLPPPAPERKEHDKLVPLECLRPGLPKEVYQSIRVGMAVNPEMRFQSVSQMRKALLLDTVAVPESHNGTITCLQGQFAGKSWGIAPGVVVKIGRSPDCDIAYPKEYKGVSRHQCVIYCTPDGHFMVRDENSSFGTRLEYGTKLVFLEPGKWYNGTGAHVLFGQEEFVLK